MPWNDGLTGTALRIAQTQERPLRVMSGPGTGKTFTLKRLVARLLEEGSEPRRILVVTFTRTAANDLVNELKSLDVHGCEKIRVGTLHSYCFQLLIKNEVFDYLGRHPRTLITFNKSGALQFEGAPLLEDICVEGEGRRECSKRLLAFEAAWARLQHEVPGWPTDPIDQIFHEKLLNWLKFHNAMLIGEVIPETLRYLRNNPTCPECTAFDHVIVDEYQDLNKAEQELLNIISNGNLVIVGDENQSIYRFRHANPDGIIAFSDTYPNTHDESLTECRRCPIKVVQIANNLIHQNHLTNQNTILNPFPGNSQGEVHIIQWNSIEEEAREIANYIKYLLNIRSYSPGDILVLSPRRLIGYKIRDSLVALEIPTHSFYHEEALEEEEAQKAFSLLTLLTNQQDRVALRYWLGADSQTYLKTEYGILREQCERANISPWDLLEQIISNGYQLRGVTRLATRFKQLVNRLNEVEGLLGEDLVNKLFPEDQPWARVLREIAEPIINEELSPNDLYEYLKNNITQPEIPQSGNFVKIMSLHKSKGLTSKVVIVSGCIQGLIPTIDRNASVQEQQETLREQRRLFYVAITRTREILILSSSRQIERGLAHRIGAILHKSSGAYGVSLTSQFINELGPTAPRPIVGMDWKNNGYV